MIVHTVSKMVVPEKSVKIGYFDEDLFGAEFSAKLKHYRERSGLTSSDVARALGTSSALYSRWENQHRVPTMRFIYKLAALYGCELVDILPKLEVH
jgi:DNA-binding XRE family transcriptional regulator